MEKKSDTWVFATHNKHKLEEVRSLLPFRIKSLWDIGVTEEIPETGLTVENNAFQKANFVFEKYGYKCFADDTGLEVSALGGAPGVFSARYAVLPSDFEKIIIEKGLSGIESINKLQSTNKETATIAPTFAQNIERLLRNLEREQNREAKFKTVICLVQPKKEPIYFKGEIQGDILHKEQGVEGFGYDPIFRPTGYDCSFAELDIVQKNEISHRGLAVREMIEYFKNKNRI